MVSFGFRGSSCDDQEMEINMKETYLAIDLGRSELHIGEVNAEGKILHSRRYETGYITQSTALSIIKRSLEDYIVTDGWATNIRPIAMGISLLGDANNKEGIWQQTNSQSSPPIALAQILQHVYGIACYIENNIKGITKAIRLWGNGQQADNFIYINIGTSIEAQFVVERLMKPSMHFGIKDVKHMDVGIDIGIKCSCGRHNCVEYIAGEVGFDKSARLLSHTYSTNLYIPEDEKVKVDVKEIFFLSQQGDELCIQLVENAVNGITSLIKNLIRICNPEKVILGGSIMSTDFIFPKILKKLNKTNLRLDIQNIILSQFNSEDAGLIGAAAVAMNKQTSEF